MSSPVIRASHLTKSFRNTVVVDDLSFDVNQGDIFGFLGPNGAGKSTTIRMALSLIAPDSGDVELFGKSVRGSRTKTLHDVGALIESADFYEYLSARANLKMLCRLQNIRESRIDEVLDMVELLDRADDRVKAYSHGMKQRLGIAQALLSEPKLLILDEPTTGLDPKGMKSVRNLIADLGNQGITIFLSSHLLYEVEQVCTSLAIINKGKLIVTGSIRELMQETNLFTTEIQAAPKDKAKTLLENIGFIPEVSEEGGSLKVNISREKIPEITQRLVDSGVEIFAVIPRSSLEDYFLSITSEEAGIAA
ncbi:MAG: ABC transporter ATP-binding protein [Candidatus Marinimicrobia bacterium]|nr:ABC transporter ATP-binding protein [Candidatus Neomarinimicrobiota bacterium]MCF7828321.1 ABC transporter ATP-binding protein [Candidatus Neomarinimicrobiota bacterium]MCF7879504.1 ABC transporter ATP-binding protein [Candidatus Neomarinimicrobiota bacterium]